MRDNKPLSLLVRNLRYTTSPDRVRKFFEQFGEVRDVYLPLDYYSKLPRGFGFVEFASNEDAEAALDALSRHAVLDGAEVSVTVAQQGRKSPDSMRNRERNPRKGKEFRDDYRNRDEHRKEDRETRKGRSRSYSGGGKQRYRSRSRSYGREKYDKRRGRYENGRQEEDEQRGRRPDDEGQYRTKRYEDRDDHRRASYHDDDERKGSQKEESRGRRDESSLRRQESPRGRSGSPIHEDRDRISRSQSPLNE